MKIIDTHAHYDDEQFDTDRDELLSRILSDNVLAIIDIGCDLKSCRFAVDLAAKYDNVFAAVGFHPENINSAGDNYIEEIKSLAQNKKVVAIGEIGLDYHYEGYDRERQIEIFENQIKLANELSLPVIIHSRDATADTMEVLKRTPPKKAVMHCYSGSAETARELIKMGLYISFTGVLTFKNSKKAVSACEVIPFDRLMTETDSPYMAPVPYRGKRCDSSYTIETAKKIAEIKGIEPEKAVEILNNNAIQFFDLDISL